MKTVLGVLLLMPAAAFASSAFDGTWMARLDSIKVSGKPDVLLLADGEYTCSSCVPQLRIKADGTEHALTGSPYFDALTVTIVSATTIQLVYRDKGKEVYHQTDTVAADGNSYIEKFTDRSGTREVTGVYHRTRVSAGPPGAHVISGTWQRSPGVEGNETYAMIRYQLRGDHFRMQYNGSSYDAPLDGTPVPIIGDPGHTTVSLRRIDANTILETDRRNGKVTDEVRIAAAADGRTISVLDKDLERGQTITFTLDKGLGVFFSHHGCAQCRSLWAGNGR